jgi:hypothetical protein
VTSGKTLTRVLGNGSVLRQEFIRGQGIDGLGSKVRSRAWIRDARLGYTESVSVANLDASSLFRTRMAGVGQSGLPCVRTMLETGLSDIN